MSCNMDFDSLDIDVETAFVVGRRLMEGEDVESDLERARVLLQRAADAGHPLASSYLARLDEMQPVSSSEPAHLSSDIDDDDPCVSADTSKAVLTPSEATIDSEVRTLLSEVKQLQEEINKRLAIIERRL